MLDRASGMATDFALTVHRGVPADWPGTGDLGEARAHIFQTREFMQVWADTFGAAMKLDARFVDVRDADGALLLRAPFAIETRGGVRVLTFADQSCGDYNAPLLYPTAIEWKKERAEALWRAIEAALPAVDLIELEKMPARVGDCVNPFALLADEANPEACHGSDVMRPWSEIEATQSQVKTLKRKARGLEKLGDVHFFIADGHDERERVLARLLQQKQRRFEDTRVPGFVERPLPKHFFERATEVFAATGNLRLAALEVDGELVATSWTVALGATVYELMIGYEAGEWAKYSPGRVLNLKYLEWAKRNGFTYVDHGIGEEAWKYESCDTHVPLGRLVFARTGKGRRVLARRALMGRIHASRIYRALRPYKWIVKRALRRT